MSVPRVVTRASVRNLKPSKRNVRTHSKKQIRQLANVVLRYGWTNPILIDEQETIIAGHGRYQVALQLGLAEVPVIVMSNLSETEKRALALADNKIAANSGWDRAALAAELDELAVLLPECDLNIDITGFEPADIDTLMGDLLDPEHDPADDAPHPAQQTVTTTGDLWKLGPHRLKCGDSLSPPDVRQLMGSEFATQIITDPPFNVKIKSVQGRGKIKHPEFMQASGEMTPEQFTVFLQKSMMLAAQHSVDGSIAFWFIDWRHIGEMLAAGKQVYGEPKNLIVWAKTIAGMGSFYRSQHELIFVFKKGDTPHLNNFELGQHGRNRSNLWSYQGIAGFGVGRMEQLKTHPTSKPVAMIADAMKDCSNRGDVVLDLFCGSGTSILAAEKIGRRGYGLEIDPRYVDATVRRWQTFTKRDAILDGTCKTFDEIATERSDEMRRRACQ